MLKHLEFRTVLKTDSESIPGCFYCTCAGCRFKMSEWRIIFSTILLITIVNAVTNEHIHSAVETEMFSIPISPNLFNWTYQEFDEQYRFHAALLGKPELPSWLRYIYSGRHHSGFIFGTPPRGTSQPITLEVIGLNRQDYETRRVTLTLLVSPKEKMARHEVEFKIDNLNVEDLLDEHRMTRLMDILRMKLWTESSHDLHPTFLASAIDMGARLPLKPEDGEGVVVRLGSTVPFSSELQRLREEVRPLSRLPSCPRDFKRTTVERLFRDAGLTLDWCSFELYNVIYKNRTTERLEYLIEIPNTSKMAKNSKALDMRDTWSAPSLSALPSRNYSTQLLITEAGPLLLLIVSVAALTVVLCFHYNSIAQKTETVTPCHYGTGNTEQSHVPDNTSNQSQRESPNNSLVRSCSPKSTTNLAGSYNRPQPPPYMGSANNSLHHRKPANDRTPSTSTHTPEHTTHSTALEESLKLLNEANISKSEFEPSLKNPIIDLIDGTDDYVPLEPETGFINTKPDGSGYVSMKPNLDDAPELVKYGLDGVVGLVKDKMAVNGKPPVKTWFC